MTRNRIVLAMAALGLLLSWPMPGSAQPPPYGPGPGSSHFYQNDPFYRFAGQYPGTAQQLRSNPYLLSNKAYMRQHPEVFDFLKANPGYAQELHRNPNMLRQGRYSDRDWDDFYKRHGHHHKKHKHHKHHERYESYGPYKDHGPGPYKDHGQGPYKDYGQGPYKDHGKHHHGHDHDHD